MNINKVIANGQTIVDLTDTTATADDVKIGKLFHDVSGALTSGTFEASGLEYEEGTFTPEEDIIQPKIYFNKTHSKLPCLVSIIDAGETVGTEYQTMHGFTIVNYDELLNGQIKATSNYLQHGFIAYQVRYKNDSAIDYGYHYIEYNNDKAYNSSYMRYYITENYFSPCEDYNRRYWRANRTYKWIAIWK